MCLNKSEYVYRATCSLHLSATNSLQHNLNLQFNPAETLLTFLCLSCMLYSPFPFQSCNMHQKIRFRVQTPKPSVIHLYRVRRTGECTHSLTQSLYSLPPAAVVWHARRVFVVLHNAPPMYAP